MPRGAEQAARTFCADVLGMTEIDKPPALAARGGAWFRRRRMEAARRRLEGIDEQKSNRLARELGADECAA